MAVSGGYIYKQVKCEGLQAPLARTQQPAEPTANADFGTCIAWSQKSGFGVDVRAAKRKNTMNKPKKWVSPFGVTPESGGKNQNE